MRTILIVDDLPSVRDTIGFLLAAHDYNVVLAANGPEALAITMPFDVALIDLYMPGGDGFALCRALRERLLMEKRTAPVLMMTAAWTPEAAAKATAEGAVALLTKPFTGAKLVEELERALGGPSPTPATPGSFSGGVSPGVAA
jgi:CheY-like chemotaxis protein